MRITNDHRAVEFVGLYFHTFDGEGGLIHNQGQVVSDDVGGGHYLVRFHSWVDGSPTTLEVRSADRMQDGKWRFYISEEEWREEGQRLSDAAHWLRKEKAQAQP